jgi:hypothetical protein
MGAGDESFTAEEILEIPSVCGAPHRDIDAESRHAGNRRSRNRIEHEDSSVVAISTEPVGLSRVGDAEPPGATGHRAPCCHLQPVAVSVGLDHCGQCCWMSHGRQCSGVVGEDVDVDFDPC